MEDRLESEGQIKFRTDRFYSTNSEWYFCVRRGPDQGPFVDRSSAENALIQFIQEQKEMESRLRAERELLYNRKFGVAATTAW